MRTSKSSWKRTTKMPPSNHVDRPVEFDPIPGKVVIEITDTEERYGSIIIPAVSRETRVIGTVHTVFRTTEDESGATWEPFVHTGDTVIIGKYTGTEVTIARHKYVILKEADILSIVRFPSE